MAETPFLWSTNLSDDEVRAFYGAYSQITREADPEPPTPGVIRIPLRFAFLDFADGVCFWTATGEHHTVLYRSHKDWELWNARQAEIEELRQEQAQEEAVEKKLLTTEDQYLAEKTEAVMSAGNYDLAAALVTARAELRRTFNRFVGMPVTWTCWYPDLILARFPASRHGIEFCAKYRPMPTAFTNFAHWFAQQSGLKGNEQAAEVRKIYEAALNLFPDNPRVMKEFCLYWRRIGHYDAAISICREAISKRLKDGTATGFEGRLIRLEKEMSKKSGLPKA